MPSGICIIEAPRRGAGNRDGLVALVHASFGVPARHRPQELDLTRAFDTARRQHNATILLQQVVAIAQESGEKTIAVVEADLFIPVLTFVFGQAQLDGVAAVISTHRLANEFYGMPANGARFQERIHKEVLHELGHLYGLYHCHQFECVMRSSTYVEEIDLKRAAFCPECAAQIKGAAART